MKGKVVIVTGASSGIGKALANEFAVRGASVVLAARSDDVLKILEADLSKKGLVAFAVKTDVAKEDDCRRLINLTVGKFGRIDILVNNAGISMRALFTDVSTEVIRRLMEVNFWGAVYCTKYALPYLLDSKGSVVGVSSVAGFKGLPGRTGYSASKFALHGFLETLRIENRKTGLHVLIACPGFTASNIRNTALKADGSQQGESPRDEGKMMQPEKVAQHMIKAIVRRKPVMILSFEGKFTFWMNKFFPLWMDRIAYHHMAKEHDSPFK